MAKSKKDQESELLELPAGEITEEATTHTDLELSELKLDAGTENALRDGVPQTGTEAGEDSGYEPGAGSEVEDFDPVPQTEAISSEDLASEGIFDPIPQTGSELTEDEGLDLPSSGDLADLNAPPQTGSESSADTLSATGGSDLSGEPSGDASAQAKKRTRKAKKADADQADGEDTPKVPARRRGPKVVSIDAERTVETSADKLRNDLLDMIESLKGKKLLTGTIQGVERAGDNPNLIYAVIYHGNFKVIIPALEAVEEPEDYRDQPKNDVLHYLLNKRLGAEVDYIIKGVDQETGVAVGSRLEAMAMKRKEYYFRTDRDGNYQIYEGACAEARVTSVIRAGVFVDLFGAECYVPLKELSYQRWVDAAAHYQPGQRVLVKVLELNRTDRNKLQVTVSVKQASDNPYETALKRYTVGSRYVGTVSMVDLVGVFVSLDGGIDCLCSYPKRGRPPRGARVTVRILGIDHDSNRIWGAITHMSTTR